MRAPALTCPGISLASGLPDVRERVSARRLYETTFTHPDQEARGSDTR